MPAIQIDKRALLAGHFLLGQLDPDALGRLAATATFAHYPAHATIFEKGDPGVGMMAVVRGRVKICSYSMGGKELVLNIIDRGGLFGEVALLDGRPRTAHAVTLEETDLLVLERGRFLPFLTANPEVAIRLISVLCDRLRQTSEHLEDALFLEAGPRLARWLLRFAASFGKETEGGVVRLNIKLSQQQIGNLVGISRESINKHIGDWQRAGYLAVQSGFITIRDREALEEIGEAEC
jgi:CRP/FNR family transcriptional regulator, cyclic AMP receptor protein